MVVAIVSYGSFVVGMLVVVMVVVVAVVDYNRFVVVVVVVVVVVSLEVSGRNNANKKN